MSALDVLTGQFLPNVEGATLTVKGWRSAAASRPAGQYAQEVKAVDAYVAAVKAGQAPVPPVFPFAPSKVAQYMIAAAQMAAAGAAPPAPPSSAPGPAAPLPPAPYDLPAGATTVTYGGALASVLAKTTATDIILADGTYDQAAPFVNHYGHRIYAQHLGGATLTAGIEIGGNSGGTSAIVRGVVFDVSSAAKVLGDGIVHVWGPAGAKTCVLDCVFRGNKAIGVGVLAYNPDGLVAQRLVLGGFTDCGLRLSDNKTLSYGTDGIALTPTIDTVSDIDVDGVTRATPGASNGRGEAGLWIGHPVKNGVRRIRVRNASWSGIETVNNAWNTVYSDLDIDMSGQQESDGVGIYLEHFNYGNLFESFSIVGAETGINAEWADPSWGGRAAAHNTTIRNGTIDAAGAARSAATTGVFLDEGTEATRINGVKFRGQTKAAIIPYRTVGANDFTGNDYSELAAGAAPIGTR